MQEELLSKKDLTYETALRLEISLSRECALNDAEPLTGATGQAQVHKVGKRDRIKCQSCGQSNHKHEECYFKDAVCHACKKKGHIRTICRAHKEGKMGRKSSNKPIKSLNAYDDEDEESDDDDVDEVSCHSLQINRITTPPYVETLHINGKALQMEIDTGAAVSVIGERDYKSLQLDTSILQTNLTLTTYTKEAVKPIGICKVNVRYQGASYGPLDLYMLENGASSPLLGRDWLREIKLNWMSIKAIQESQRTVNEEDISELKVKYKELLSDTMGKMTGVKAKIDVKDHAKPKFLRARPVPLNTKELVNIDIERLVRNEIISPVKHSEWVIPIVPVEKSDGSIRICGDFRVAVNPVLNTDIYPQPRREELFAELASGEIDLASAYFQMEVEKESKQYLTINTQKGIQYYLIFFAPSHPLFIVLYCNNN